MNGIGTTQQLVMELSKKRSLKVVASVVDVGDVVG
jgi:hypothetical protein